MAVSAVSLNALASGATDPTPQPTAANAVASAALQIDFVMPAKPNVAENGHPSPATFTECEHSYGVSGFGGLAGLDPFMRGRGPFPTSTTMSFM